MTHQVHIDPVSNIILDKEIYPRSGVSPKHVALFAENILGGFEIDPIEAERYPHYSERQETCRECGMAP